jgi:hypothetical protein
MYKRGEFVKAIREDGPYLYKDTIYRVEGYRSSATRRYIRVTTSSGESLEFDPSYFVKYEPGSSFWEKVSKGFYNPPKQWKKLTQIADQDAGGRYPFRVVYKTDASDILQYCSIDSRRHAEDYDRLYPTFQWKFVEFI